MEGRGASGGVVWREEVLVVMLCGGSTCTCRC